MRYHSLNRCDANLVARTIIMDICGRWFVQKRFVAHLLLVAAVLATILVNVPNGKAGSTGDTLGELAPPVRPASSLAQTFADAAAEFDVPLPLLLAIGYAESRWEQQLAHRDEDGSDHSDGGWGIMHLVDRPDNDSLRHAAALLKLDPTLLQTSPEANVRGGAALLRQLAAKSLVATAPLESWQAAVAAYSEVIHPGVAALYTADIYRQISTGASLKTSAGEQITLSATAVDFSKLPPAVQAELKHKPFDPTSVDYPDATWNPAYSGNYQSSDRPNTLPINYIIIHDTEGSYAASIAWFQNPASNVAAHYIFRSSDGDLTQMVRNKDVGYHAGNWPYNQRSIGIEHEGYASNPEPWYTDIMYRNSAALTRHLADRYGVPKDRRYIISHKNVPNQSHWDPGPGWDFGYYMGLVRGDSSNDTNVDNLDSAFHPVPTTLNQANNWYATNSGSFYGTGALYTYSAADAGSSTNSALWQPYLQTGTYDVYAHIPYANTGSPDTNNAVYTVNSVAGTVNVAVDQGRLTDGLANMGEQDSRQGQWADLGRYTFETGTTGWVRLTDFTGESGRTVWFDAVKFVPVEGGGPPVTVTPGPTFTPQPPTATPPPPTSTPIPPSPTPIPLTATPHPTLTPGACGINFADLLDTHWAYGYISNLYCADIISGFGDGLFHPGYNMSRAQFAKILTLSLGWPLLNPANPTFNDVSLGHWAYRYIETANAHGAMSGGGDGRFQPEQNVSRAQLAASIVRARGFTAATPGLPTFADVPADYWAYGQIEIAASLAIVSGFSDGNFRPDAFSDRAQLAKIIRRSMVVAGTATATPSSGTPTATATVGLAAK